MARRSGTAVLLIDVINSFDFPGARALIRAAKIAAPKIEDLCERARAELVPVIYVNDNFGRWSSDFKTILAEHRDPSRPAHEISERLTPKRGDYFVLKPQHTGFYATPLDLLPSTSEYAPWSWPASRPTCASSSLPTTLTCAATSSSPRVTAPPRTHRR